MIAEITDAYEFLSKTSVKRLRNAISNQVGFKKALRTKSPFHPALPISLSIEPTTSCNLRCPECPSGLRSFTRPTGMLDFNTFKKIIDELYGYLMYLTLYFQGEPFLHPGFFDLIRYASDRKIYTATSTNAHFLNEENAVRTIESGLNRLIISLDGTDQASYEKYRIGGDLEKVIDGIKNIMHARKNSGKRNPYIILQFIVFKHNINRIDEVKKLAAKLGADKLELKTAQVYDFEKGSDLIPKSEIYSRYQMIDNAEYHIKSEYLNKCRKMWQGCVMTWDGNIVPCCFDKDAKYTMGNIRDRSFNEIWNGERYLDFRSRLFENRKEIDICRNCTEGLNV
jgi:radical SAM protein with 4Fe4S-binding SPASM domain